MDGRFRTVTDSLGMYSVGSLTPGSHELRFSAIGYAPRQMTALLSEGSNVAIDIELTQIVVVLPTISVLAPNPSATPVNAAAGSDGSRELGRYRVERGWQGDMISQGADVQKALAAVPGIAGRGDDAASISIRGGSASENLLLLDGIPIYSGSHFGSAASAIMPDAVSFMDVHTGVSSARFGGRLSGVVELETADSGDSRGSINGAVNASDVRTLVRGRLGSSGGGYMVGGRTTFRSAWQVDGGFTQEANYRDFIGVARLGVGGGSLRLVSFLSGNQLGLQPTAGSASPTSGTPADSGSSSSMLSGTTLGWRSTSLGGTWTRLASDGSEARLRAWYAGTGADITWLPAWGSSELHSAVAETGFSAEVGRESARGSHLIGASVVHPATRYSVRQLSSSATVSSGTSTRVAAPTIMSLFTEWSWRPSSRIVTRGGLRGNAMSGESYNLEPRLDLTLHTSPATHIDLGAGRSHQALQTMFNEENLLGGLIGLELPSSSGGKLPTATADQVGLGIEHRINDRFTLTLDSYLRRWDGVPLPASATGGLFVTDSVYIGSGHASGVVAGASFAGQALAAHATVSVGRSVREFGSSSYHAGVERPWAVAGGIDYRFGHHTAAQLSFSAGAGSPSSVTGGADYRPDHLSGSGSQLDGTPVNLPGPVNVQRLPGYSRVDLGVRRNWAVGVGGLHGAVSATVRVTNLLNTPNGIGVEAQGGNSLRIIRGNPRGLTFELGWIF